MIKVSTIKRYSNLLLIISALLPSVASATTLFCRIQTNGNVVIQATNRSDNSYRCDYQCELEEDNGKEGKERKVGSSYWDGSTSVSSGTNFTVAKRTYQASFAGKWRAIRVKSFHYDCKIKN